MSGVMVTGMAGDIGTGVVVIVYRTPLVGGVHSMVTVELPVTLFTTLTSLGVESEKNKVYTL